MNRTTTNFLYLLLLISFIAAFMLSLMLGSVSIPTIDILSVLLGGSASKASWNVIILKFRLPKAITATLAGAALSLSGLQMQTLFRNPLAGPFVLGINAGASLGVAIVVLLAGTAGATLLAGIGFAGDLAIASAATIGSFLVLILILLASNRTSMMTLLILGLMFGYITSAIVSLLLYFSIAERIQAYIAWTFGSFGGVTWSQMNIMAPMILLGLLLSFFLSKTLNAFLLGEQYAQTLGVPLFQARFAIILSTSIMAGTVTAFCGPIGFLGIAVPHLCRMLFQTSDHHQLFPAVILLGGSLALLADIIAQLPGTQTTLPLNSVMALLGAPIVIWVILRQNNLKNNFA